MESVIAVVGFLSVGKTTLLKTLIRQSLDYNLRPYLIINDYENANIDAQQFASLLEPQHLNTMSGSCICCSRTTELRSLVNDIPKREKGLTFIEANGTTDACDLMSFLCVGLKDQFLPPCQVSVVDTRLWKKRGDNNELEASQVKVSSLIILSYVQNVSKQKLDDAQKEISQANPFARIEYFDELTIDSLD